MRVVRAQPNLRRAGDQARTMLTEPPQMPSTIRFSHNHFYVDHLRQLEEYKQLEAKLNEFSTHLGVKTSQSREGSVAWRQLGMKYGDAATILAPQRVEYSTAGQDFVEQLLVGLGWRVTGQHIGTTTQSLLVTSKDPNGVRFIVTAPREIDAAPADGTYDHFDKKHLDRFGQACHNRQGCAVLGFSVSWQDLVAIHGRYQSKHPKLCLHDAPWEYDGQTLILEVFAYYTEDGTDADRGTVLRFVATKDFVTEDDRVLPGVQRVPATFDEVSLPVFCDHWVSNVHSRTGFLDTLHDTLGFAPKVDFNAGVVAAGEAQIESTVTGNSCEASLETPQVALRDQSQIYLPINNALSDVGHVGTFLKEIGQGVQHVASRVEDLVAHIHRANVTREMTGAGLSFLQIPRSYYGRIIAEKLAADADISLHLAETCIAKLHEAGLVDAADVVDLDASIADVVAALPRGASPELAKHVLRARYSNLHALLRDRLTEEQYLEIVRNNILVDVQGGDLLLQIFTSKILTRTPRDEGPFLEFIERVCYSQPDPASGARKPLKPGCGGFGIRNFLTLFLSIEVTEAAAAREAARRAGDTKALALADRMVDAFTAQLTESNPILTRISDAMTAEGQATERGDLAEAGRWAAEKDAAQAALMEVSTRYKEITRRIREERSLL